MFILNVPLSSMFHYLSYDCEEIFLQVITKAFSILDVILYKHRGYFLVNFHAVSIGLKLYKKKQGKLGWDLKV